MDQARERYVTRNLESDCANEQEYQITHPSAQVNGILKGAYYGTISDQISITCTGGESSTTKLRTLLDYKDEVN
jgi:hypothetical protein